MYIVYIQVRIDLNVEFGKGFYPKLTESISWSCGLGFQFLLLRHLFRNRKKFIKQNKSKKIPWAYDFSILETTTK